MNDVILNPNIKITGKREHLKASEKYIDVVFKYGTTLWEGSVPTTYRRTGTDLESDADVFGHLNYAYESCNPKNWENWLTDQELFWVTKPRAGVTKGFFTALSSFTWKCQSCQLPPNPNWARRTQDLKEFGYTLATDTSRFCKSCKARTTHLLLLPLPRGGESGYETWSSSLLKRIISVLNKYDVYEAKSSPHILPDHKFPEIRWDKDTRRDTLENLSDADIRREFQLISNQRNQQKREACRACFQSGRRPALFGIPFYYKGGELWPSDTAKIGAAAEAGCEGCGWYDIQAWRSALISQLKN